LMLKINGHSHERQIDMQNIAAVRLESLKGDHLINKMDGTKVSKHLFRQAERTFSPKLRPFLTRLDGCKTTEEGIYLLHVAQRKGIKLHVIFFNKIMTLCARERDVQKCRDTLDWMIHQSGIEPDVLSWSAALKVALKARDLDFGIEIWTRMRANNVELDTIAYNTMISICSQLPQRDRVTGFSEVRITLAEQLFEEMRERGLEPSSVTFGAMINVCAKSGRWQRALELFSTMETLGFEKDEILYNSIMDVCVKCGELSRALEWFEKACKERKINLPMYTTAMHANLKLNQHDKIRALRDEMLSKDMEYDIVLENMFTRSLARQGLIDELEQTLKTSKFKTDERSYASVIHELYTLGDHLAALRFFERGYEEGRIPIWSSGGPNILDLHRHNGAVACCAIRFVLKQRIQSRNMDELCIVVGRGVRSNMGTEKTLGDRARSLLNDLDISFSDSSYGGAIVISPQQMCLLEKKGFDGLKL